MRSSHSNRSIKRAVRILPCIQAREENSFFLGQLTDLQEAFESLKGQFHLPAGTVKLQHHGQCHFLSAKSGDDDHKVRVFQGGRRNALLAACFIEGSAPGPFGLLRAFANGAQPCWDQIPQSLEPQSALPTL